MKDHITSNKDHFVRNHGGIPTIDSSNYTLEVGGLVARPGTLTLDQIKDRNLFPQVEMTVTLQCCGTRRVEQIALYPGEGDELLSAVSYCPS
jgi:sulfite oxidase